MRRNTLRKVLSSLIFLVFLFCLTSAASAVNIYVSGFNADEIFENGSGATTTAPVDISSNAWGQTGFRMSGVTMATGLPDAGSFTSGSSVTYYFGPYSGNNALRLIREVPRGTIEVIPDHYTQLHVLATSGNAGADNRSNIILNFSDGPSSTYANALYAPDWWAGVGGSSNVALGGLQRVGVRRVSASSFNPEGIDTRQSFQFYESVLTLTAEDQAKTLASITFSIATGTGTYGVTNVYAVDGSPAPVPGSLLLLGSGVFGLFGYRVRRVFSRS